jgi:4-amino-4-deoxy-L-arabinose transferase-like glycosyltransferase
MSVRPRRSSVLAIALLVAPIAVLYVIALGTAPIYLHEAEVLFARHAYAIATTAHDVHGRLLPLYFQMAPIGEDVWFQPALVYWSALFLTVLPVTEWTVRLPSVAVALIDVVLIYFVARRIFPGQRAALFAPVLLAITPAHFIHGRVAMDYLYPVPFVLGWLLCLLVYLEHRRPSMLFLATSLLGLGLYTYIASVLMMPLYLAVTGAVLWMTGGHPRAAYWRAAAGFAWPLLFLIWLLFNPAIFAETLGRYQIGEPAADTMRVIRGLSMAQMLDEIRRTVRFSELTGRISLYWYFFDPAYLFVTGGYANVINSTRRVGVFLLPFIVFVPAGIAAVVRHRTPISLTVLVGFFTAPLAACLVVPEPWAVDRELVILPFGVLLAVFGIEAMLASPRRRWRAAAAVLLALVPLHFAFFLYQYYGDYRVRSATWFNNNRRDALESIIALDRATRAPAVYLSTAHIRYLDDYWRLYLIKHDREDLLARSIYVEDAAGLDVRTVPRGALFLASRKDVGLQSLVEQGQLRRVMDALEPGDPSYLSVLQR